MEEQGRVCTQTRVLPTFSGCKVSLIPNEALAGTWAGQRASDQAGKVSSPGK